MACISRSREEKTGEAIFSPAPTSLIHLCELNSAQWRTELLYQALSPAPCPMQAHLHYSNSICQSEQQAPPPENQHKPKQTKSTDHRVLPSFSSRANGIYPTLDFVCFFLGFLVFVFVFVCFLDSERAIFIFYLF